ncbi:MAG: LysR family transcriptional regulator [Marinobacterium sp.]|nr:LysR family transcriptional regulator [Marinobacterium sp.]
MELICLRTFKAVVDEGGIGGASKKLHTVQSNITSRIRRLEDDLDCKLFQRQGRRLVLTHSGETLYQYTSQMLQLAARARQAVQQQRAHYELRIGTPEPFAAVHLPAALQQLQRSCPQIHPKLHIATSSELTRAVLEHKLDCAFVGNEIIHPQLQSAIVVREQMMLIQARNSPQVPVMIVRNPGCAYREQALQWQRRHGRVDDAQMVMGTVDGLLGCVAAGLGYSVISKEMVINSRYESSLQLLELSPEESLMNISLIWHRDTLITNAAATANHSSTQGIQALAALF